MRVEATYAAHDGARPPYPARAPAIGYAILGSRRVYFAGDTDLFPEMEGLVPDLDLALVPIWGWGPTLGRGAHLDPEGAAEAIALLRPKVAVPIHWGTMPPSTSAFARSPRTSPSRRRRSSRPRRGGPPASTFACSPPARRPICSS